MPFLYINIFLVFSLLSITSLYIFIKKDNKSIFFIFIILVQYFYLINTPLHNVIISDFYAVNKYIKDIYPFGFFIIFFHLFIFIISYLYFKNKKISTKKYFYDISNKKILITFLFLYSIIFINTLSGGINLIDILKGKDVGSTLGLKGTSYYLQNFADSLITLIIASFVIKLNKLTLFLIIFLSFILFLILGFRYRIILTIFALLIYFFYTRNLVLLDFLKIMFLTFSFFYFIFFITSNRSSFFTQKFDKIDYNPYNFDYSVIYDQTRGSVVDFAMYKALQNKEISHDYGNTMFLYVFIKIIPAQFFKFGEKPYPPPMLLDIDTSLSVSRDYGEASTILGASYYSFSIFGIILFSIVLAFVIASLENTLYFNNYYFIRNVMILMSIFQLITRGYFPQFLDHLVYMLFPLLLIRKKIKI